MTHSPSLLIPDVHQDIDFLETALASGMAAGVAEIILLGDLLDGRRARTRSSRFASQTLACVEQLLLEQSVPTTLLWGNHDYKYWKHRDIVAAFSECPDSASFVETAIYGLSLHTLHALAGTRIRRRRYSRLGTIWGQFARLAVYRHGYVISHAGIHNDFWPRDHSVEESVALLNDAMRAVQDHPAHLDRTGLTEAGAARLGDRPFGGPLWLDWDDEFKDDLPFPQIVGHTPDPEGARNKGRSWCIDGGQSCFAFLYPDGTVEPQSI
jgi:hypothetical protein